MDAMDKANADLAQAKADAIRGADTAAEGGKQTVRGDVAHDPIKAVLIAFGVGLLFGVVLTLVFG